MKCIHCGREIRNKGSLVAHQMSCSENPNRVQHRRSPKAGAQKGNIPWNKGKQDPQKVLERSIEAIESGAHLTMCEAAARKHAKRYLIHKNGHKCEICGIEEWMGQPVPLVIDHIDGDTTNNAVENFRIVCCNCDAQLPTYKSKNKKGRKYDREYYRTRQLGRNPAG